MVTPPPENTPNKYTELTMLFRDGINGNNLSYQSFLQKITPILHRIVSKKIPAADVEDVVQEILISVHKSRHTFDGERPIMPWLLAIAGFRITDALRKFYSTSHRECVDINELAETLTDVTEPEGVTESIDDILEGVAEREKKILTLMHVEGYTAKETGLQLDMKESAVKVAAHRAIKKIREKIRT